MPEALPGASEVGGIHEKGLESQSRSVGEHHGSQEIDKVLCLGPGRLHRAPPLDAIVLALYHLLMQMQIRKLNYLSVVLSDLSAEFQIPIKQF